MNTSMQLLVTMPPNAASSLNEALSIPSNAIRNAYYTHHAMQTDHRYKLRIRFRVAEQASNL